MPARRVPVVRVHATAWETSQDTLLEREMGDWSARIYCGPTETEIEIFEIDAQTGESLDEECISATLITAEGETQHEVLQRATKLADAILRHVVAGAPLVVISRED